MRTLYFDCFSGISGDMTVGALLDLGADLGKLIEDLKLLNIGGYEIKAEKKLKNGIMGTDFNVILEDEQHNHEHDHHEHDHHCEHDHEHHDHSHAHTHEHHHSHHHEHRSYKDIVEMIDGSTLEDNVKELSKKIFQIVGQAEAKIHGKSLEEVHFHEVGAVDSIVDIVGTAICIEMLNIDRILFSKIPLSRGFVNCQHGVFPLPAPASLEILKDVPVYYNKLDFEIVTPTGAGIVKALADGFSEPDNACIKSIAYGLGKKSYEIPNVLRAIVFEDFEQAEVKKN